MSRENVEIVEEAYRAYRSGGIDAALEFFHPDIEWEDLDALPGAASYRGHEEFREAVSRFYAAWDDLSFTPEEFIDADEAVVVAHRWRGTGKSSGTPIDTLTWNVFVLRDGKIIRRRAFQRREAALQAAELSRAISEENVEIVRRGYEALAAGDFDTVLDLLDADAEIRSARQSPDGGISIGHSGLMANFARLEEAFEDPSYEVEELVEAGDQIMAIVRMRARGRGSGLEVEETLAHVWTLRGGKGVALDIYLDRREAVEAIGLRE